MVPSKSTSKPHFYLTYCFRDVFSVERPRTRHGGPLVITLKFERSFLCSHSLSAGRGLSRLTMMQRHNLPISLARVECLPLRTTHLKHDEMNHPKKQTTAKWSAFYSSDLANNSNNLFRSSSEKNSISIFPLFFERLINTDVPKRSRRKDS